MFDEQWAIADYSTGTALAAEKLIQLLLVIIMKIIIQLEHIYKNF